ncbi:hypothetical protein JOQ06_008213 [Pogonophryne albipinna]|uniref:HECT-type E3 ubiquitin transferase n=4 Tax=Pogonophryne albipinna TaxID=1090488 RepID=A0AAD6AJ38_9TELE|nr:hypothetical protein JOQ06_008213 [Pogonophryne albipinna]
MIGFTLARAGNTRLLTQLQATTMADLKRSVGRSRVYIIPQADIPTSLVMASSSASAALRPAGAPSASAASTSATDSEGAPSASAASTSATDSEGAPSASAASTSATDSEGAPSASAASTSATDSEGAPSASAASTSATDSEGAPSASAASTSATDSEGAPSASTASTSATDSEGAPSASAASTSATDSEGAPSASAASTSATDSEGAPSASAASTSATDSEGAPSASAASTSATDSEGAPSASAASTSATDSEGAPSASAASTSATDSEGAPSASAASTSATDSEGAPSASAASTSAATETVGSTTAPIPPSTYVSMDADVESLHSAQWVNAGTPEVFYRRSRLEQPNRNSFNDFLIDDSDEEEEGKDEAFGALESYVFPVEEVDLAVLLSDFRKEFVSDGLVSNICIRRKKLLESAIKAISRVTFCWNNSPYIEFVGEDGDDMGGPQREFFRLLMIEVQTSMGIFEGKAGQVFLTYDQAALDGHKYFQAGRLIAWSVAHGGPCIKALDPSLYQLMCGQEPQLEQFDCSVLPDPDVQSRAKRILQCKTAEDLSALQQDLGDWISECGVPGIFSATIGEIPKIYSYVVKHYIFLRTAKMVNQFTEGMNAFGKLWDLVRNNWIAFLPCFTNMRTPLTKSSFKAIFKYEYSPRGTNHREKEEDTIYSWELVLNLIEDKLTELTFEDLLIFITGADEVPTLGFPNKPSIDFYTQEAGVRRLPYASTCAMTLFLPRGITEEQELHNILNQSVKDSWGFLKV